MAISTKVSLGADVLISQGGVASGITVDGGGTPNERGWLDEATHARIRG